MQNGTAKKNSNCVGNENNAFDATDSPYPPVGMGIKYTNKRMNITPNTHEHSA